MRVLIAVLAASVCLSSAAPLQAEEYQSLFTSFITQYGKTYAASEFFSRFNTFKANLDAIREHNSNSKHSYKKGVNAFTDLTADEFSAMKLGYINAENDYLNKFIEVAATEAEIEAAPASIDWRTLGAVTPIKDQGNCGSCWSFSTTGSVEGAVFIAKKQLISLSEQELVDCSKVTNHGCNGGLMNNAFNWIIRNGGLGSEESYPYTAKDGTCKKVPSVATISGFTKVPSGNEDSLVATIAKGPVSVAVDATTFKDYKSGVYANTSCGKQLNHGVLAVGYGTDPQYGDYYIVKNSWGTSWGESGYIRMARGKNLCGIANEASQPFA